MSSRIAELDTVFELMIERLAGLRNEFPETKHAQLRELGKQLGLAVITDASSSASDVSFDSIDVVQQNIFAKLLEAEFAIYDKGIIRKCGLQRLVLCKGLVAHNVRHPEMDMPASGLTQIGRFVVDTLILSADSLPDLHFASEVVHHELFHAIDYRDTPLHFCDPGWRELNGPEFTYNNRLQSGIMPPFDHRDVEKAPRGFLNTYAMQNVFEDKATVYGKLVMDHARVMSLAKDDEILAKKIDYMKHLLREFDPHFDESFWRRIDQRARRT